MHALQDPTPALATPAGVLRGLGVRGLGVQFGIQGLGFRGFVGL